MPNFVVSPDFSTLETMRMGKIWLCLQGKCTTPPTGESYWEMQAGDYIQVNFDLTPWISPDYGILDWVDLCQAWLFNVTSPDALVGQPALGAFDIDVIEGGETKHFLTGRHVVAMPAHDEACPDWGELYWWGTRVFIDCGPELIGAKFQVPRQWTTKIIYHPYCYAPKAILPRLRMESIEFYLNCYQGP